MLIFIYCNVLWLIAGFVAGVTSFGGNLVAVPFITLAIDPKDAILAGCISGTAVFAGICLVYRKNILWHETIMLTLGACAGIPLGIWFLASAGAPAILLAAGAAIILFLLWQFAGHRMSAATTAISPQFAPVFGFFSGIMMAAVGMGGPPLVLYTFLRQLSKEQTLGTINAASTAFMFFVLPWQYFSGLFNSTSIQIGLSCALFSLIGIAASIPVVKHINIKLFRLLLLAMLALSALTLIWRAI